MRAVGSREFKNRMGKYLRQVQSGEVLLITGRNRPVAQLSPASPETLRAPSVEEQLKRLAAGGHVQLAKSRLKRVRPRAVRGKAASRMILEARK